MVMGHTAAPVTLLEPASAGSVAASPCWLPGSEVARSVPDSDSVSSKAVLKIRV